MITLKNVILRRSAKKLLDGATVNLNPGEKVGLVGRNGAGKSSLFALFNGSLHEDGGDFYVPKQWRMAQVAQDMPETDESATEFVVGGDTRLTELRATLAAIEAAYEANPEDADIGMELAHAYTDLADAGEHDAVPRAQALILGLGFKSNELDGAVNSFSGGWRMRLQLARALMCPSDLLLLDEPTNHLDLDALVWLEAWLQKYAGTMIVISHDREFLDAVTDVTLHIANAQLTRYGGNYSAFETCAPSRWRCSSGLQQAAGQDRPPAEVHRPLQGQGQQGQAGAKPREGAGAHGESGAAAGRGRLHLRVQGAGQHSQPDAVHQQRELRL
jgi:ATP-binding cassette subfamily F protein 3